MLSPTLLSTYLANECIPCKRLLYSASGNPYSANGAREMGAFCIKLLFRASLERLSEKEASFLILQ